MLQAKKKQAVQNALNYPLKNSVYLFLADAFSGLERRRGGCTGFEK